MAQSVCYQVLFTQTVKDLGDIILDYIQPPALPHVQVWMIYNMPQTLVIRIDNTMDPI